MPASHDSVFTGRMPFLPPTNSIKALKEKGRMSSLQKTCATYFQRFLSGTSGRINPSGKWLAWFYLQDRDGCENGSGGRGYIGLPKK